jgi:hypothetical protein
VPPVDMGMNWEEIKGRIRVTGDMSYKIYDRVFLTIGQYQDVEAAGLTRGGVYGTAPSTCTVSLSKRLRPTQHHPRATIRLISFIWWFEHST